MVSLNLGSLHDVVDDMLHDWNCCSKPVPKRIDELIKRVAANLQAGEFDRALANCDRVTSLDQENVQAILLKAKCLFLKKELKQAYILFDNLVFIRSKEARLERAKCYAAEQRFEEAINDCSHLIADANDSLRCEATLVRARCFQAQNRFSEAVKDYSAAMAAGDLNNDNRFHLATCLFKANHFAQAVEIITDYLAIEACNFEEREPKRLTAFLLRARAHQAQNNLSAAIVDARIVQSQYNTVDNPCPEVCFLLATLHQERKEYAAACAYLRCVENGSDEFVTMQEWQRSLEMQAECYMACEQKDVAAGCYVKLLKTLVTSQVIDGCSDVASLKELCEAVVKKKIPSPTPLAVW